MDYLVYLNNFLERELPEAVVSIQMDWMDDLYEVTIIQNRQKFAASFPYDLLKSDPDTLALKITQRAKQVFAQSPEANYWQRRNRLSDGSEIIDPPN